MTRWLLALLCVSAGCHRLFGATEVPPIDRDANVLPDMPPGLCGHREVATGRKHTCALDAAGDVWCWGANESWQVAAGGAEFVLQPTKIDLPSAAAEVAAGRDVSCARLSLDGSVWCWGANDDGELGQGVETERMAPNPVDLGGARAIEVDVGAHHVCIRRESDSSLVCWGNNRYGEAGVQGGALATATPALMPGSANMLTFDAGHRHNCSVTASGSVTCWGKGGEGQLGAGTMSSPVLTTALGISNATAVSAAGRSSCAVANGSVRCWGENDFGQLGTGAYDDLPSPGVVVLSNATDVSLGTGGACALRDDTSVECWGAMLTGNGTWSASALPSATSFPGASQVSVGYWHACAIVEGEVQCWGRNSGGELGRGQASLSTTPVLVSPGPGGNVVRVSLGRNHVCAITQARDVYCWGENDTGQLGIGSRETDLLPRLVTTNLANASGVAAGYGRSCVWNGTSATCWGNNDTAVLGTGTASRDSTMPVTVSINPVQSIGLGDGHTCAVTTSDTLKCWGDNTQGQLGIGSTADQRTPTTVAVGTVAQVVAGNGHTCARKLDATLSCWGHNSAGEVGNNSMTDALSPVSVLSNVQDVSAGDRFTCAVANMVLYCWGANSAGQLGLGDRAARLVPTMVQLPGNVGALDVEVAGTTACVRAANSKTYCWGDGSRGQLGSGVTLSQRTPLESPQLAGVDSLSLSTGGGCALRAGVLSCWGETMLLGNGDISQAEPRPTLLACP